MPRPAQPQKDCGAGRRRMAAALALLAACAAAAFLPPAEQGAPHQLSLAAHDVAPSIPYPAARSLLQLLGALASPPRPTPSNPTASAAAGAALTPAQRSGFGTLSRPAAPAPSVQNPNPNPGPAALPPSLGLLQVLQQALPRPATPAPTTTPISRCTELGLGPHVP